MFLSIKYSGEVLNKLKVRRFARPVCLLMREQYIRFTVRDFYERF